ncbi:MAG TPA: tyrosine-protein phosphatase [Gammaproteobacteria bacterium]|nr:tyrosine-protein phosphatase [Gammaproteobacteria bacterium]
MTTDDACGAALLARHRARKIELAGSCNMRDLGGLATADGRRTRRGRVYRSDALATLTDADCARLAALGIRAVYDFRTEEERARAPNRLDSLALVQHPRGFIPRGNPEMFIAVNARRLSAAAVRATMLEQYARLALDHTEHYAWVFRRLLSDDGAPAILHCASGKDRTGVGVALLLLAVGVTREEVLEDYAISHYQRRPVDMFRDTAVAEAVEEIMSAHVDYLAAGLAAIEREHGSIDAFVARGLGLTPAEREALIELLVE